VGEVLAAAQVVVELVAVPEEVAQAAVNPAVVAQVEAVRVAVAVREEAVPAEVVAVRDLVECSGTPL
jgi:hypothetical protein